MCWQFVTTSYATILLKFALGAFFPVYLDSIYFDLEEIRTQSSGEQLTKFSCSEFYFIKNIMTNLRESFQFFILYCIFLTVTKGAEWTTSILPIGWRRNPRDDGCSQIEDQ